jgi:hypothetical protein
MVNGWLCDQKEKIVALKLYKTKEFFYITSYQQWWKVPILVDLILFSSQIFVIKKYDSKLNERLKPKG